MKKLSFLTMLICSVSCMDRYDSQALLVVNKTSDSLYSVLSYKEFNTIMSTEEPGVFYSKVLVPDKQEDELKPKNWDGYLMMSVENKLYLFFVKKDSVDKYGWEAVHAKNLYNKKYTLDIDDLDSLNWTIEYNGN